MLELEILLPRFWAVCVVYGYTDLAFEIALQYMNAGPPSVFMKQGIMAWAHAIGTKSRSRGAFGSGRLASFLRWLADRIDLE